MTFKIEKEYKKSFVYSYIPSTLISSCVMFLNEHATAMEKYLKSILEINDSVYDIVVRAFRTIKITEDDKYYRFNIDTDLKIGKYKLIQIAKLIEYGNSNVKGLSIFSKTFKYVKTNIKTFESMYETGFGGK